MIDKNGVMYEDPVDQEYGEKYGDYADKTYVIVVDEKHFEDQYDEDDTGRETHSLGAKSNTIEFVEVKGIEELHKRMDMISEANADNPPYDEYHILTVFEKETKEKLPKYLWYKE